MYNLTTEEVFSEVKSSRHGLDSKEAKNRLLEYGKNEVKLNKSNSIKNKLLANIKQTITIVLLTVFVLNFVVFLITKEKAQLLNVGLIAIMIAINISLNILITSRMEKTLGNIKHVLPITSRVKRNDKIIKINSEDLVIGDIIYLKDGDIVPADIRLIDSNNLRVIDTIITGQTMATEKTCDVIDGKYMPLGDRHNMVYMGSSISGGTAIGVVVATGKNTELGKTEKLLQEEIDISTPLIKKLNTIVGYVALGVGAISVLSFVLNLILSNPLADSIMVAVSLAVCVIPESLFVAIYMALIRGVKQLGNHNLHVKNLASVETLGSVDVLCVDKTKVLTINNKMVKDIWVGNMDEYDLLDNPNYSAMINCMLLCNDTKLEINDETELNLKGSNTEKALLNYALANGFSKDSVEGIFPRVNVFPYDRYRKMMTSINSVGMDAQAFTRGEFEEVFKKCTHILIDGKSMAMTDYDREYIARKYNTWKQEGASVMGFATSPVKGNIYELLEKDVEHDMTFVGLCSILDPAKEGTEKVLKELSNMDVKVVMMTSDSKESAFLIAKKMGIARNEKQVVTGDELDMMTDVELNSRIDDFTVFSKLLYAQKLRVVKALQLNNVVAVTGDNSEDITAIKRADVGIGLAASGAEVVKQTAPILTADDSLKSICEGIKASKQIQFNVAKILEYVLGVGLAQLLLMAVFVMVYNKPIFSPTLLLWFNFISGIIPCFALCNQGIKDDIHKKPKNTKLVGENTIKNIAIYGVLQALIVWVLYMATTHVYCFNEDVVSTMCFVAFSMITILHAYNVRSGDKSMFSFNTFNNHTLNIGVVVYIVLSIIFVGLSMPGLQETLGIAVLDISEWAISVAIGLLVLVAGEIVKLFYNIIKRK